MIIVVLGPTAVGKSRLGVTLAKQFNGEVINADSTQIYKGLDVATAKILKSEMDGVVHHLIDIKNVEEEYNTYDYQRDCRNKIKEIFAKGKTPILVGGTGLYIKSALYDYKFGNEVQNDYSGLTDDQLYEKVNTLDSNNIVHKNNRKRLENALNYMENTNLKYSEKKKTDKLLYDTVFIGLTTDRKTLYNKINNRVDSMIEKGLLAEAKDIFESNVRTKAVLTPIGYKELFPYFENKSSLDECLDIIKQKSRNYAKRQFTWFNNQMDVNWFNTNYDNFSLVEKEIIEYIKKES
jgi:tRNA dimethylallyltransferase